MNSSSDFLNITSYKERYKLGETVIFIVKNAGNQSLTFPDTALGLKIKNIDTAESYRLVSAQIMTELKPRESKTIKWDQEDSKAGNYTANITSGLFSANTCFKIEIR
jgi:hypothetical protein